jgi:hypothetical protein
MTFPEQPNEAKSLERLFEAYARVVLAQMNTWAALGGRSQRIHRLVDCTNDDYTIQDKTRLQQFFPNKTTVRTIFVELDQYVLEGLATSSSEDVGGNV